MRQSPLIPPRKGSPNYPVTSRLKKQVKEVQTILAQLDDYTTAVTAKSLVAAALAVVKSMESQLNETIGVTNEGTRTCACQASRSYQD